MAKHDTIMPTFYTWSALKCTGAGFMKWTSSDKSSEGARLAMSLWEPFSQPALTPSQMQDLRLAASKMTGAARRAFQAEMTLKYCRGSARLAETILGWSREAVAVGLAEHRTGILCLGAQSACSGRKRWEEQAPQPAAALAH